MKHLLLLLTVVLSTSFAWCQKITKVFLNKSDSTVNYYTAVLPAVPFKGVLIVVPGFGENGERVLSQTGLPVLAAKNGLLTIIPVLQDGVLSFGVDSASQSCLSSIIADVNKRYHSEKLKLYIGGFSIGGSAAIKYAELNAEKVAAVFAIDPPLDFERFYSSAQRDVRLSVLNAPSQENVYMIKRIEAVMGGTPASAIENYYATSPYSFSDSSQRAIKGLLKTPLRIYSEPDINWWIRERNSDVTAMNIADCSAMINELRRLGHLNAELIVSVNKGFREPGHVRHPHSWSIVDNGALVKWLVGSGK